MRVTLTIDDDLAVALKAAAQRNGEPFDVAVNRAIRLGLSVAEVSPGRRVPFQVRPVAGGFAPGVDPMKLNQLADQLEMDESVASSRSADPGARRDL